MVKGRECLVCLLRMPVRYWCPHAYAGYINWYYSVHVYITKLSNLRTRILWHRTWGKGQGDGAYKNWSGPTSTKAGLHTWSYILSYCRKCPYPDVLSSLGSISTLPASFILQGQHPLPITIRPHSSIPSPSLSHAMFPVWTSNILSPLPDILTPRLPSLLSLSRFTPNPAWSWNAIGRLPRQSLATPLSVACHPCVYHLPSLFSNQAPIVRYLAESIVFHIHIFTQALLL